MRLWWRWAYTRARKARDRARAARAEAQALREALAYERQVRAYHTNQVRELAKQASDNVREAKAIALGYEARLREAGLLRDEPRRRRTP